MTKVLVTKVLVTVIFINFGTLKKIAVIILIFVTIE